MSLLVAAMALLLPPLLPGTPPSEEWAERVRAKEPLLLEVQGVSASTCGDGMGCDQDS